VEFQDLGIVVHGQGYAVRDVMENLAHHYPKRREGWTNVGVLHTAIQGVAGHASYAPCTITDLTACEYEYFALGHVHQRGEKAGGNTPVWFSGNLQGRQPRENGPKGALVVDFGPDAPAHVRFAECDVARWEVLIPDLTHCSDVDDVVAAMAAEYQTALGLAGDRPLVVRFRLEGETTAAHALASDPERLMAEARSLLRTGSTVERVILDCVPPASSPTIDPELAAHIRSAAQTLAEDPDKVRQVLDELRGFGFWRLTKDTEIDLDNDEILGLIVRRASRQLSANLES
jgi:DNA repair exonuclease SbcCD nuclease subunit